MFCSAVDNAHTEIKVVHEKTMAITSASVEAGHFMNKSIIQPSFVRDTMYILGYHWAKNRITHVNV